MPNKLYTALFVLITGILFSSCSTTKKIEDLTDDDIIIAFRKGPCFGDCPVYTLKIYSNNYAKLIGERNIKKLGIWAKMLHKDQVKLLTDKFEAVNFLGFDDEYPSNIPDLPTISISYKPKKVMKTVNGKLERPTQIMDLQFLLEKYIEGSGWEQIEKPSKETETPRTPTSSIIYNEIIIEPATGVRLPTWFDDYKKYGVRLIKKIAPNMNLWLITYNENVVAPKDMMKILKDDERIKTAEFNKSTSSRD